MPEDDAAMLLALDYRDSGARGRLPFATPTLTPHRQRSADTTLGHAGAAATPPARLSHSAPALSAVPCIG